MNNIKITNSLFYDSFTGIGGGGVPYFPGNVMDDIGYVCGLEVAWNLTFAKLYFLASDQSVTMVNQLDSRNFYERGFKVSDTIDIVGSASNNGSKTIESISENGKTIFCSGSFTNEMAQSVSIHGTTPITAFNFYYNIIPNDSTEDYFSLTDSKTKQKVTASGLDATNTTPIPFSVATKSYAWVVNDVNNNGALTGFTIKGAGITDYKQKFQIVQSIKKTSPIYLAAQFNNFQDNTLPEIWENGLRYICLLEAKYSANTPVVDHTGGIDSVIGFNAWFDEAKAGARPGYEITEINYKDASDNSALNALDVNKTVRVTMSLSSRGGKFVNGGMGVGTKFILCFNTCPSAESDYQNTETNLIANFFVDSAENYSATEPVNGANSGTTRQVITAYSVAFISTSLVTIEFIFSAGSLFKTYWQSKQDTDRYYSISLITQDVSVTETSKSDRVTCRAPFASAEWDKIDPSLSSLTRTGIEAYKYPDQATIPQGNVEGCEGEKWLAEFAFRVNKQGETTPTLKDFTFQILAKKTGKTDFVLEQKTVITSGYKKYLGNQQVNFEDERGFIGAVDDIYNTVFIVRDSDNDTATKTAFIAHYGLVLRYEHWINALDQFQILNGVQISPIVKDINSICQRWSNYNNQGWSLIFKVSYNVTSLNGADTPFWSEIPIVVKEVTDLSWPSGTGSLTHEEGYFIWDDINEVESHKVQMIIRDGNKITLVRHTYTGNYALSILASGWHGMLFANYAGGSVFDRRTASTNLDSETDSPWNSTPENEAATYSFASTNARINIFLSDSGVQKIEIESLFNSTLYNELVKEVEVYSNLGLLYINNSSS